jgi:hypothetical protein
VGRGAASSSPPRSASPPPPPLVAGRVGRGDRPKCSKAAAARSQPPLVIRGSPPGRLLLPPDLLPLQQELPAAPVRVGSVVVIPAMPVVEDGPVGVTAGVRGRRLSPASGRLPVRRRRHLHRSWRISTACASTASAIHTSPRDAPTLPGAFGVTGSVSARRTARSRGFFGGGRPATCPSLLARGGGGVWFAAASVTSGCPATAPVSASLGPAAAGFPLSAVAAASGFSPADAPDASGLSHASPAAGPSRSSSSPSSGWGPSRCCWVVPSPRQGASSYRCSAGPTS